MKNKEAMIKKTELLSLKAIQSVTVIKLIQYILLHGLIIKIDGDVELNPGLN